MDIVTGVFIATGVVLITLYLRRSRKRELDKIPGPKGYPFVGNAFNLDPNKPHETLFEWAEYYGDVMKINVFGQDIVIANSLEGITEVLVTKSNAFAGRCYNYRVSQFIKYEGISHTDLSRKFNFLKKVTIHGLKQVGNQLIDLEEILQKYLNDLMQDLQKHKGRQVDVYNELSEFVYRITFVLTYGREPIEEEHELLMKLNEDVLMCINPTSKFSLLDTIPIFRGPWFQPYRILKKTAKRFVITNQKISTIAVEEYNTGVKSALTPLIKEMKNPSVSDISPITFDNVCTVASTITIAGVITTHVTLYYFISMMAANPEIQEEAHEHIIEAIGQRSPCLEDRAKIPYMESMMYETLRLLSQVPVGLAHKTMEDTTLQGYKIPKGTQVWTNLWHLHHDDKLWTDPWQFKPKRFLGDDGQLVSADHPFRKQFFAFGAGRRVCAGESFAKHRVFLTMVSLVQKFRFQQPDGETINTDPRKCDFGLALALKQFRVIIELRH